MGINSSDFRQYVIRPTLTRLGNWSTSLENLLLGSAATASQLGDSLGGQQGLGVYRISVEDHHKVWDEFLALDPDMASKVRGMASQREFLSQPDMELATNLIYATAIAWGIYAKQSAQVPENEHDELALATCWQNHFRRDPSQSLQNFLDCYGKLNQDIKSVIAA